MCVIMLCTDTRPSLKTLELGERRNRDGAGVAWIDEEDGERFVFFEKGLDADEVFRLTEVIPFPFIVHFRYSTAGGKSPHLCHPFPISPDASDEVSGKAKRVLFHNGSVSKWDDRIVDFIIRNNITELPDGDWSDTRAAAFMTYHIGQFGENFLPLLSKDDRFVVLDADAPEGQEWRKWGSWYYCLKASSETPKEAVVRGSHNNEEYDGGILFSNTNWKQKYTKSTQGYTHG